MSGTPQRRPSRRGLPLREFPSAHDRAEYAILSAPRADPRRHTRAQPDNNWKPTSAQVLPWRSGKHSSSSQPPINPAGGKHPISLAASRQQGTSATIWAPLPWPGPARPLMRRPRGLPVPWRGHAPVAPPARAAFQSAGATSCRGTKQKINVPAKAKKYINPTAENKMNEIKRKPKKKNESDWGRGDTVNWVSRHAKTAKK